LGALQLRINSGTNADGTPIVPTTALDMSFGPITTDSAIGDRVWEDANANGVQDCEDTNGNGILGDIDPDAATDPDLSDQGDECDAGIRGAEVELYPAENEVCDTRRLRMTTTDGQGFYLFAGLDPGEYCVRFIKPVGYTESSPLDCDATEPCGNATDSDADPGTGWTEPVTLTAGEINRTLDAGFYKLVPLKAAKTAVGSYTRKYDWTLEKRVDFASHSGQAGEVAGSSEWNVVATRSVVDSGFSVTGSITVTNPNPIPVALTSVTDILNDGTAATVDCPTGPVPANSSVICTYSAAPADASATGNKATISSPLGQVVATAPVVFVPKVIGDETVTLADERLNYSQSISTTTAPTFPETFNCPADTALYTNGLYEYTVINEATLKGDKTDLFLRQTAKVDVKCTYQPTSIGDFVWNDANANGQQDDGANSGLAGSTVTLWQCGPNGQVGGGDDVNTGLSQVTPASGAYLFSDLAPGCYFVTFTTPAGYEMQE
jgi:hypothetical protein